MMVQAVLPYISPNYALFLINAFYLNFVFVLSCFVVVINIIILMF